VEVSSASGKGTSFFIYLPAVEMGFGSPTREEKPGYIQGRNEEILVVDDEAAILEITRETLAAYNYRVLATTNSEEAVSIFARHATEIDLVITDMLMPGLDGPGLIRALRSLKPDVRCIAVSGVPGNARNVPTNGFLKKPYSTSTLLEMVRTALDA